VEVGTVITLPDVALAELTASFVDFVWIDLEHGALSTRDVQPLAIAARSAGAECYVRLASAEDARIGPAVDAGADGIVIPRVQHPADAELVVARLRYPPRGSRGMAARRASGYGSDGVAGDPRCVVQIESRAAVGEADRIAAVDGVEALVVGCADLALDLGNGRGATRPHDLFADAPDMRDAIQRVRDACEGAGIGFGLAGPGDPEAMVELAGALPGIAVFGADVRIYAGALTGLREAHVCS
jgi:4-hydroxy-2-oxoheptanedioate aldolase